MKRKRKKLSSRRAARRTMKRAVVKRRRKPRSHTTARGGGRRRDPNGAAKLVVRPMGVAKTIIFKHRNGRTYSHQFKHAKLYVTAGGGELIIAKVSVDRSTLQIRG